jgi:hypothetical protein
MRQPRMTAGPDIARSQDFILGAGGDFDLVGTCKWLSYVRPRGTHMMCWSGSSVVGYE